VYDVSGITFTLDRDAMRALDAKLARLPLLDRSTALKAGARAAGRAVVSQWRKDIPVGTRSEITSGERGVLHKALTVKLHPFDDGGMVIVVGAPHERAPHEWVVEEGHRIVTHAGEDTGKRTRAMHYGDEAAKKTKAEQTRALDAGCKKAIDQILRGG